MGTLKLAWRNIWRNTRRTLATVSAMSLALFVTIIYSGMIEGFLVSSEEDALNMDLGGAQIFHEEYQDRPSIYTVIPDADGIVARLKEKGVAATPRLLGGGLIAAGDASSGAQLKGIDVATDGSVLILDRQVLRGDWVSEAHPKGVVLGRKLAYALAVDVGDEVVLLSQATDGSMANDLYRVRGVLRTVGEVTDRTAVLMPAGEFRNLLEVRSGAHQIIVRRPADGDVASLKTTIVEAAPGMDVKTWRELSPTLASYIDSTRGLISIMFFIVYVVIGIVLLNAMLMAVFERVREFGVMKALGMSGRTVFSIIYAETLMLVVVSMAIGLAVTAPVLWYLAAVGIDMGALAGVSMAGLAMGSKWVAIVNGNTFSGPISMMLFVVLFAVLYPALKAAVIRPVAAMRHQ